MKNGYFLDPEQKKYIIESLLTSQLMNINFQKIIFWIYVAKIVCKERNVIGVVKFRWKVFFWIRSKKVHQKVHQFTPCGMWLEMKKLNELLYRFILNDTHTTVVGNVVVAAESQWKVEIFFLWVCIFVFGVRVGKG